MLFFDYGVDIEGKDLNGWMLFYFVIIVGYCNIISLFIDLCVNLVSVDGKGCLFIDCV